MKIITVATLQPLLARWSTIRPALARRWKSDARSSKSV